MGMVAVASTRRSDEQLKFLLYETANWTVIASQGVVLCEVASLRLALEKAGDFVGRGGVVIALICKRFPRIVILSDQVWNMESRLAPSLGWTRPRAIASENESTARFDAAPSVLIDTDVIYLEAGE
jgi:hypothetical protein